MIANSLLLADCIMLIEISVVPAAIGFAGKVYLALAIVLGLTMRWCGWDLIRTHDRATSTRRMITLSLSYLPILLLALALDRI